VITFQMPVLALLATPVCLTLVGLRLVHRAGQTHSAPLGSAGFYLMLVSISMLALGVMLRVQLSPAGVRIRTMRRRRLVGWAEIYAITVEPQRRGGPRVVLWTTSHGRIRLPVPMANKTWNEAAFLHGYHQIGQYWLAAREPYQHPVARTSPPGY